MLLAIGSRAFVAAPQRAAQRSVDIVLLFERAIGATAAHVVLLLLDDWDPA